MWETASTFPWTKAERTGGWQEVNSLVAYLANYPGTRQPHFGHHHISSFTSRGAVELAHANEVSGASSA